MFKIPKSLVLGGQKIKVTRPKEIAGDKYCDGMATYQKQLIEVLRGIDGEYAEFVFIHELVHHILNQMSEERLRGNEKFVNQFATFLHQALKTMK